METGEDLLTAAATAELCPHSLGKLIEWKLSETSFGTFTNVTLSPHSLGKLIEWKLE
jgi:hypothetical protein